MNSSVCSWTGQGLATIERVTGSVTASERR